MCLNSRQVSLSFHKWGKRRSERLGDVPMVTREACCAPETEHRSIGSFGMQSVLGTLQESTASLPMDALFPALPTLPHPHQEAQNFRKKLKCKKYATSYNWFCFCFLNTFFFLFFFCACTPTLFSSSIQNTQDSVVGWLVSSGVFSPLIKCCWLFCTCYFMSFPPLVYSYLYHMERIKQFWFFPMILRNAIFITGYSQRRRKENLRMFPSAVFLSRHCVCPSPPLFCSVC